MNPRISKDLFPDDPNDVVYTDWFYFIKQAMNFELLQGAQERWNQGRHVTAIEIGLVGMFLLGGGAVLDATLVVPRAGLHAIRVAADWSRDHHQNPPSPPPDFRIDDFNG